MPNILLHKDLLLMQWLVGMGILAFFVHKKRQNLSDDQLIAKYVATQDIKVLSELYSRYMQLVYGLCLKYFKQQLDAEDAVMEIFEKIQHELLKHEVKNFKSWLYQVSRNFCLMQLRSKKNIRQWEEIDEQVMENHDLLHQNNEEDREHEIQLMLQQLNLLPEHQKICLQLFYLEKKCYKEIVDQTGFDLKKVKSYIQNGKRKLKQNLIKLSERS